jgi:spore coat protein U-like protein
VDELRGTGFIKGNAKTAILPVLIFMISVCGLSSSALAYACTVAVTSLTFGSINVLPGTAIASTATLSISCTAAPTNAVRMCINISGGTASDATSRLMNGSGSNQLRYQLYSNSTRTTPWGSWSANLYGGGFQWDITHNGTTVNASTTVYGSVLASQSTVNVGSYSSTLSVSMNYLNNTTNACPNNGTGSTSTTFTATATVVSNCTLSAAALNFGTASVLTSNVDASSSLNVTCNNSLPYALSLNGGNSGATDPTQRKMTSGANQLTYGIYRDSARSLPWGSTSGTNTVAGTGTGSSQGVSVFGRVPVQTTPAPATYQDSVIATVTY